MKCRCSEGGELIHEWIIDTGLVGRLEKSESGQYAIFLNHSTSTVVIGVPVPSEYDYLYKELGRLSKRLKELAREVDE